MRSRVPESRLAGWYAKVLARTRLRLVEAVDPGDPADWFVNEPLTYRTCVACGGRAPYMPDHHVSDQIPRREYVIRGRGRSSRHLDSVNKGPDDQRLYRALQRLDRSSVAAHSAGVEVVPFGVT